MSAGMKRAMEKNTVCELLDIRYPILQGGMLWLADARLAAAVSNAGGLGTLSPYAGMDEGGDPVENLHQLIAGIRQLTDRRFAVNIPLDLPDSGLLADVLLNEEVKIAVTSAGDPGIYTELFHSAGIRVLHVAGSVSQARRAESCGVDAVIVEGAEAGGRIGREEIPLFTLIPQAVEAVSIPVVAAGGIVAGQGMAAAFALGAGAVQMGTRFIATEECPAHPAYKKAILASGDEATMVTRRGAIPVRSLKSRFIEQLASMERSGIAPDRIREFIGRSRSKRAQVSGDMEGGDAYAGSSAGRIRDIISAGVVIRKMMEEYEGTVRCLDRSICDHAG